ncbi:hypothetical protein [Limnoglobus roseus]|uniref:Uncharacterized protein n=1 Tax=Limnoglobus roseus TaxID=2598579 RepID=A0A5C1AIM1_9BACT|nr:hypothetical protein [Limnoglobus roseus]QEL17532.1 hypothetical protein PX52LOC_04522 [Limnoglobus roseus]
MNSNWYVDENLDSGSALPQGPGVLSVLFRTGADLDAPVRKAAGGTAIAAAKAKAAASDAVKAYFSAKRQLDEAVALAAKAEAAAAAAKADADLVRLRPSETLADDVRAANARGDEAAAEYRRRQDDVATIRKLMPELHRRAGDVIGLAAQAAIRERNRDLRAERTAATRALCAKAGAEIEDLAVIVFATHELAEHGHLIPTAAVFQTIGHPPKA